MLMSAAARHVSRPRGSCGRRDEHGHEGGEQQDRSAAAARAPGLGRSGRCEARPGRIERRCTPGRSMGRYKHCGCRLPCSACSLHIPYATLAASCSEARGPTEVRRAGRGQEESDDLVHACQEPADRRGHGARVRSAPPRSGPRGRPDQPGDPAGRHDAGSRRDEPVQHGARRRLRGVPAHLQPPGRVRQGRASRRGLRRQLGAIGRPRHLPHPRRDDLVRREARDLEGRLLLVGPRHGGDQGRVVHRLGLPRSRREGRGRHQDRMPG